MLSHFNTEQTNTELAYT